MDVIMKETEDSPSFFFLFFIIILDLMSTLMTGQYRPRNSRRQHLPCLLYYSNQSTTVTAGPISWGHKWVF